MYNFIIELSNHLLPLPLLFLLLLSDGVVLLLPVLIVVQGSIGMHSVVVLVIHKCFPSLQMLLMRVWMMNSVAMVVMMVMMVMLVTFVMFLIQEVFAPILCCRIIDRLS